MGAIVGSAILYAIVSGLDLTTNGYALSKDPANTTLLHLIWFFYDHRLVSGA